MTLGVVGGLLALILVAGLVRGVNLDADSLSLAELHQVEYCIRAPNVFWLIDLAATQGQPALNHLLIFGLLRVLPFSDAIVRAPACVSGVVLVALTFVWIRKLYGNHPGLLGALLVAFSPAMIQASRDARSLAVFLALQAAFFCCWFGAFRNPNRSNLICAGIFAVLMLQSRGVGPLSTIVGLNVAAALVVGVRSLLSERSSARIPSVQKLCAVSFIAWVFFLPFSLMIDRASNIAGVGLPGDLVVVVSQLGNAVVGFVSRGAWGATLIGACCVSALIAGVVFSFRDTPERQVALLAGAGFAVEGVLRFRSVSSSFAFDLLSAFPGAVLLGGIAVFGFTRLVRGIARGWNWVYQVVLFVLPTAILAMQSFAGNEASGTDYRGAVQWLSQNSGPQDILIADTFRRRGDWEPGIYGRASYDPSGRVPAQLTWDEAASKTLSLGSRTNVTLYLHESPKDGARFSDPAVFVEKPFRGITVIRMRDPTVSAASAVRQLAGAALTFYPNSSSRFDPIVALALLSCEEGANAIEELRTQARDYGEVPPACVLCPANKFDECEGFSQ